MFTVILGIHTILCLTLIGLVLIQQGKGADMGAAFGGGSNTVFGAGGAADFITRLTTGVAIAFMATSILLVKVYSSQSTAAVTTVSDPLAGSVLEQGAKPESVLAVSTPEATPAGSAATVGSPQPAATVAATQVPVKAVSSATVVSKK